VNGDGFRQAAATSARFRLAFGTSVGQAGYVDYLDFDGKRLDLGAATSATSASASAPDCRNDTRRRWPFLVSLPSKRSL